MSSAPQLPVKSLRSGELARLAGLSADALRFYERRGLLPLPPRAANGYRRYSPQALARVQLIRRALRLGFSVEELARILKMRDSGEPPCKMVRAMAGEKLLEVDHQMKELARFRRQLVGILRDWDRRLKVHGAERPARLLESVTGTPRRPHIFPPSRTARLGC